MKKRSAINDTFKWDLTKFCKSDKEWYEKVEGLRQLGKGFAAFKGKLGSPQMLLKLYALEEEFAMAAAPLGIYCSCNSDTDLAGSAYVEMGNILTAIGAEIGRETSFIAPELLALGDDYLMSVENDKRFKNYAFGIYNLRRSREHVLSENEEVILSATGTFAGEFSNIFHSLLDLNLTFSNVENGQGKMMPLNWSLYSAYMSSADRTLRKNAFNESYKQVSAFADTISNNYIASLKADWFYAQTSRYESVLKQHLHPDNISDTIYNNLIKNVHENLPLLHTYYRLKGKLCGLSDFSYYDMYASPVKNNKKYTYENAQNLIIKALAPLGEDYTALLKESFENRWIDVYPNKGKRTGAYQTGCYGFSPVVLLNFKGITDDVFTLAHELGHAMHTYYSNEEQPMALSGYTIFLAEVASTVNEVLLLKYLYANSKNNHEKIYYLDQYLQMFKGTIFRQTMFAEFEHHAHKLVEENQPISKDVLTNVYEKLNKVYQGAHVKHNKNIKHEWLRIPHFYTPYYVYKYATGLTAAITLASAIYNGAPNALENYKTFLRSGGKNFSVEILKSAGVDLETTVPYDAAFDQMKWALNEWKKLTK